MDFDFGIATIAAIVIIAFFVGEIIKATPLDNKWIPVCCGVVGIILGLVAYYIGMPAMSAEDPITAAAIGLASGFAATGIHQVYKQLKNSDTVI